MFSSEDVFLINMFLILFRNTLMLHYDVREDVFLIKRYKQYACIVKEFLNKPGQVIRLHYLEKRRHRMRLKVKIDTFLNPNPFLFNVYYDSI